MKIWYYVAKFTQNIILYQRLQRTHHLHVHVGRYDLHEIPVVAIYPQEEYTTREHRF